MPQRVEEARVIPAERQDRIAASRTSQQLCGFVFDQARWYDPSMGQFLSQDPLGAAHEHRQVLAAQGGGWGAAVRTICILGLLLAGVVSVEVLSPLPLTSAAVTVSILRLRGPRVAGPTLLAVAGSDWALFALSGAIWHSTSAWISLQAVACTLQVAGGAALARCSVQWTNPRRKS